MTMEIKISYFTHWDRDNKVAKGKLTEKEAIKFHKNKDKYYAIIDDPDRPTHFIEIEGDFYAVGFYDEILREYLTYAFQASGKEGFLFLTDVIFRDYHQDSGHRTSASAYHFSQNGTAHVTNTDYIENESEEFDVMYDSDKNYEPIPEFGKYDSLLRTER
jgi:hypothetical protein